MPTYETFCADACGNVTGSVTLSETAVPDDDPRRSVMYCPTCAASRQARLPMNPAALVRTYRPVSYTPTKGAPGTAVYVPGGAPGVPIRFNGADAAEITAAPNGGVFAVVPAGAQSGSLTLCPDGIAAIVLGHFTVLE